MRTSPGYMGVDETHKRILLTSGVPGEGKSFIAINLGISLAIIFPTPDDVIGMQAELLKMRRDNELLIEPHPYAMIDFNPSNPVVSGILINGVEIKKHAAPEC